MSKVIFILIVSLAIIQLCKTHNYDDKQQSVKIFIIFIFITIYTPFILIILIIIFILQCESSLQCDSDCCAYNKCANIGIYYTHSIYYNCKIILIF